MLYRDTTYCSYAHGHDPKGYNQTNLELLSPFFFNISTIYDLPL